MMATERNWHEKTNSRGIRFSYCEKKHVKLPELKKEHPYQLTYPSNNNIPHVPGSGFVFSVSKVCHVTEKNSLECIFKDEGFRGRDSFLWWDLLVTDDDILQAKTQKRILENFTSPAFQRESRYGNFCFTFNLRELLRIYSRYYCNSTAPILRVLRTQIYKQEIAYVVLVHPRYMNHYRKYPRLPLDAMKHLCGYSGGMMSWRCQSPSDKLHGITGERRYFVWDHVSVVFHMKRDWVLPINRRRLLENLSVCPLAPVKLIKETEISDKVAQEIVRTLSKKYDVRI